MKITDSDGWITISIPREDAEELFEALGIGANAILALIGPVLPWTRWASALTRLAEGIRVAVESARKGLDISDPPS